MSKLKRILKASGYMAAYVVSYYGHEGMTNTVLLFAFSVLAMEKMNITELLKCFIIHTSRE